MTERFKGWDVDLISLGGMGANRKSNPGGLVGISVIYKLH
jgi:hypothetical protein